MVLLIPTICLNIIPLSMRVFEMCIEWVRWTLSSAVPCTFVLIRLAKSSNEITKGSSMVEHCSERSKWMPFITITKTVSSKNRNYLLNWSVSHSVKHLIHRSIFFWMLKFKKEIVSLYLQKNLNLISALSPPTILMQSSCYFLRKSAFPLTSNDRKYQIYIDNKYKDLLK